MYRAVANFALKVSKPSLSSSSSIVVTFSLDESDRIESCKTVLIKHQDEYVAWTTFSLKDLDWEENDQRTASRLNEWMRDTVTDLSRTLHNQRGRWLLQNERDDDETLLYIRYLFN